MVARLRRSASSTSSTGARWKFSAKPGAASAAPRPDLRSARPGGDLGVVVGDRGEGGEPGLHLREVLVPTGQVEVAQRLLDRRVARHDHVPGLPVPAVRREPGGVEEPVDDLVGHRVGPEVTDGAGACGGPRSDPWPDTTGHADRVYARSARSDDTEDRTACTTS